MRRSVVVLEQRVPLLIAQSADSFGVSRGESDDGAISCDVRDMRESEFAPRLEEISRRRIIGINAQNQDRVVVRRDDYRRAELGSLLGHDGIGRVKGHIGEDHRTDEWVRGIKSAQFGGCKEHPSAQHFDDRLAVRDRGR